jgi:hypothetical protein
MPSPIEIIEYRPIMDYFTVSDFADISWWYKLLIICIYSNYRKLLINISTWMVLTLSKCLRLVAGKFFYCQNSSVAIKTKPFTIPKTWSSHNCHQEALQGKTCRYCH